MSLVNLNPLGEDSLKGGVVFGSALTPGGMFSNIPKTERWNNTNSQITGQKIKLTLSQLKDSLKADAELEGKQLDDNSVNLFLTQFTELLIDYSDLRNFVFFGSAYTELAYQINQLIKTYPYKAYIGEDITAATPTFNINYDENTTIISFKANSQNIILSNDDYIIFNDTDVSSKQNKEITWLNREIVDNNGTRFPIIKFYAPNVYKDIAVFDLPNSLITTVIPHGFNNGQKITINELDNYIYSANLDKSFTITVLDPFTFTVNDLHLVDPTTTVSLTSGKVRTINPSLLTGYDVTIVVDGLISTNDLIDLQGVTDYKGLIISPNLNYLTNFELNLNGVQRELLNQLATNPWPRQELTNNILYSGTDWEEWTTNRQNFVRTQNQYNDSEYGYVGLDNDNLTTFDLQGEINLISALSLDENQTNQLLRRAIPHRIIDSLNDPIDEGKYFSRFVLIAGWFFDQIKVYIDFLKYTHELNYTQFNQLSPQFYKAYAEHNGFKLIDNQEDLSKLVIRTEPGLSYSNTGQVEFNNELEKKTLLQLAYEKQKRLLINLLYLYSSKGTHNCLNYLVSLIGAPTGLFSLREYKYVPNNINSSNQGYSDYWGSTAAGQYSGLKVQDNGKVNTPEQYYEIDYDALIDKNNIDSDVNKPYKYKLRLSNEEEVNLREISAVLDPQSAILNDVIKWGKKYYSSWRFKEGGFASLQSHVNPFYLLPLTIPDKFYGLSVNYSIPKNGYKHHKFVVNLSEEVELNESASPQAFFTPYLKQRQFVLNEAEIHLGSLFSHQTSFDLPTPNTPIVIDSSNYTVFPGFASQNDYGVLEIVDGIDGIGKLTLELGSTVLFVDLVYVENNEATANKIAQTINLAKQTYLGSFISAIAKGNKVYIYGLESEGNAPSPINFTITAFDFDVTETRPYQSIVLERITEDDSNLFFIQAKIEGRDLIVRARLDGETVVSGQDPVEERVAIYSDIFEADGLMNQLTLIYRPEGVEVYKNLTFMGLAKWRRKDVTVFGKSILNLSKKEIKFNCEEAVFEYLAFPADTSNTGTDNTRWWDLLIGQPRNLDFEFLKVSVFESYEVNSNVSAIHGVDQVSNIESELYSINFANTLYQNNTPVNDNYLLGLDEVENLRVPVSFKTPTPVINSSGYINVAGSLDSNSLLNLTNQGTILLDGISNKYYIEYKKKNQLSFFSSLPSTNTLLEEEIKKQLFIKNGWTEDSHKLRDYYMYNKLFDSYQVFSSQIVTYQTLLQFMTLIDKELNTTIRDFIPIVINLSEFGRMYNNLTREKYYYTNIHKVCEEDYTSTWVNLIFRITRVRTGKELEILTPEDTLLLLNSNSNSPVIFFNQIKQMIESNYSDTQIKCSFQPQYQKIQLSINPDWYFSAYGVNLTDDINLIQILNSNGGIDIEDARISYERLDRAAGDCWRIQRLETINSPIYNFIYYNSENAPEANITYYVSESQPAKFVNYNSEQ